MGTATIRVCDLGDEQHPATTIATAELGDVRYALDVCEEHQGYVHEQLVKLGFTPATVKVGHNLRRGFVTGSGRPFTVTEARTWLRENGYEVADRGKIAAQLIEIYAQTH